MSIYQDLLDYYQNNPLSDIDVEALPAYAVMVEKTLNDTLLEYSKYRPIYDYKFITPTTDRIDIDQDIHPLLLDIIIFTEKSRLNNDIYRALSGYGLPFDRNYSNMSNYSSLLELISNFEYAGVLKEYFTVRVERKIIGGRYIVGLIPNTEYAVFYTRARTNDELTIADKSDFEKLFVLNLIDNAYSNTKFMGETALRSVSISGMSISFGFPSIEQQKKYIQEQKNLLIKSLTGEDGYLPEVF